MTSDDATGRAPGRTRRSPPELLAVLEQARRCGELSPTPSWMDVQNHLHALAVACTPAMARGLCRRIDSAPVEPAAAPTTFGGRLRAARQAVPFTRAELASRVRCDPSYVSMLENGRRPSPSPELLDAIAQAVGVEPAYLLTGGGSAVAARIDDLLEFAEYAFGNNDLDLAGARVRQVLDEGFGHLLRKAQRDRARYLSARILVRRGHGGQAQEIIRPLLADCLAG